VREEINIILYQHFSCCQACILWLMLSASSRPLDVAARPLRSSSQLTHLARGSSCITTRDPVHVVPTHSSAIPSTLPHQLRLLALPSPILASFKPDKPTVVRAISISPLRSRHSSDPQIVRPIPSTHGTTGTALLGSSSQGRCAFGAGGVAGHVVVGSEVDK